MIIECNGDITNGVLTLHSRARFQQDVKSFPDAEVVLTVKVKGRRSNQQNRYYWSVVVGEITRRLRDLGNDVNIEVVHEFLKSKFNTINVANHHGEVIEMPSTTTKLNKEEFSSYMEKIKMWAADTLAIYIPDPGVQSEMKFGGDEV
jgi:hypothetical protein